MLKPLSPTRRFIRPLATDTLETVAARELPGVSAEEAVALLREWNPHLTRLRRNYGYLLVSDIVFVEGLLDAQAAR